MNHQHRQRALNDVTKLLPALIAGCCAACGAANAQDATFIAEISPSGPRVFLEGPIWHPEEGLLFTDIPGNRILKLEPDDTVSTWLTPTGEANGLLLDLEGRLVAAEDVGRRVVRYEADGSVTVLADNYGGQPLNSPNDLTIDNAGRIYFTDPAYRNRESKELRDDGGEVIDGVYRIDAPGEIAMLSDHLVSYPNGIAVSPDNAHLYVADIGPEADGEGQIEILWRFDLGADGGIDAGSQTMLYEWDLDSGPDGMKVDVDGNIYVAAGIPGSDSGDSAEGATRGIVVFSPDGEVIRTIPVPVEGAVANVAFGDADRETLYIMAGDQVWRAEALAAGHVAGGEAAFAGDASRIIDIWTDGEFAYGVFVPNQDGVYTVEGAAELAQNELLDYLFLDLEANYDVTAVDILEEGLATVDPADQPTLLVRLPTIDDAGLELTGQRVGEVLARGADGIIFPHIMSPEMAAAVVGFLADVGADVWSPDNPEGSIVSMLMIEDDEALALATEIADVGGYSLLSCGIGSLGADIGSAEAAEEGCLVVKDHADRVNMPSMMLAFTLEALDQRIEQGYRGILMQMNDETENIVRAGHAATGR